MVRISLDRTSDPLRMPWKRGVAVGRAYELLRADHQAHFAAVQREIGYEYCRFHGLFHDDMQVAVRDESGRLRFQWSHVDKVFDFLLGIDVRPFVELNPMPGALASGPTTFFYWKMNVTPPRDWSEWEDLVRCFGWHCVDRYGLDEVRKWYFEVWNEPNLGAFWTGTQEDYWRLYDTAARAIKGVDRKLRVGGPASAEAGWVPEFIEHCAQEPSPVDFVSTHVYPMNEFAYFDTRKDSPHKPGDFFLNRVREVKKVVRESLLPELEIHWTEWNALDADGKATIDWLDNPTIDSIYGAALTARACVELDDAADSMFWWVVSDIFEEAGMPQSPYSGTYGMVTVDGIPKPAFHAFRLLSKLRGERLQVTCDAPHGCGAVATCDGRIVRAMLWNHVPRGEREQYWSGQLEGAPSGLATAIHVRPGAGSAFETWVAMGRPQNPTPAQLDVLRAHSTPACEARHFTGEPYPFSLGPNEILFCEFAPMPDPVVTKDMISANAESWNAALSEIA